METLVLRPKNKKETNIFIEMAKAFNVPYEKSVQKSSAGLKSVLKEPNITTQKAISEARAGKGKKIKTLDNLLAELKK